MVSSAPAGMHQQSASKLDVNLQPSSCSPFKDTEHAYHEMTATGIASESPQPTTRRIARSFRGPENEHHARFGNVMSTTSVEARKRSASLPRPAFGSKSIMSPDNGVMNSKVQKSADGSDNPSINNARAGKRLCDQQSSPFTSLRIESHRLSTTSSANSPQCPLRSNAVIGARRILKNGTDTRLDTSVVVQNFVTDICTRRSRVGRRSALTDDRPDRQQVGAPGSGALRGAAWVIGPVSPSPGQGCARSRAAETRARSR
jgi:hypothetical protein